MRKRKMIHSQISDNTKIIGDALSIGTVIGTIAGWLPAVAALFAIAWSAAQLLMNWDKIKEAFKKHFLGK